ncbi:MAG: hypothetical protein ABR555_00855 [Pyrinomonadaceae bacterium]
MATGIVNRLVPATAHRLGVVRSLVSLTFLVSLLATSFTALGRLPVTILRPVGLMKLVPWNWYDVLLTPAGMIGFKWLTVMSLLFATVGCFTRFSTSLAFLSVLFYEGIVRSFGHYNHDEMVGVYYLFILAASPCGDNFSLDHWLGRRYAWKPPFAYSYPILLTQLLLGWIYFSSALVKLRVAGFKYLSPDNLPSLAIYHSLDNLHDTHFKIAFWLPHVRQILPVVVAVVLIWELVFPLAIFFRKIRWWILGFGIVFHLATLFVMNIFFPYQLLMYLVFVDWDRVSEIFRTNRAIDLHFNNRASSLDSS